MWLLLVALAVAAYAANSLWFWCDDAFINYRFSGNAYDGHGLVWNPPPFAPVEGYTSFFWVWFLYVVWSVLGVAPPYASIGLTLAAGGVVLLLVWRSIGRSAWSAPAKHVLGGVTLLAIAGNHNFATWLTSGMETMVFALWCILWTLRATARDGSDGRGLVVLAIWAALAMLTRPDGTLAAMGTVVIAAHAVVTKRRHWLGTVLSLWPLLLPAAQFVWRRLTYGEWLPNTYYAKVTSAWPESGLRYFYCFAVEQGVWLWGMVAACWLAVMAMRKGNAASLLGARFGGLVAVGVWLGYTGYYTLVVGGDHFAYRIFVHLVPLMYLSALHMTAQLGWRAVPSGVWLAGLAVVGTVPGWWLERQLQGRELEGFARVVGRAPAWLRPIAVDYDRNQAWLLLHSVGHRRALHATACAIQRRELPERKPGQVAGSTPGSRLIYRADAVGVVGWALPDVAILDGHGLNDYVIARTKKPPAAAVAPEQLRAAFPMLDKDRDGRLQTAEIEAAAPLLVSVGPQLPARTWGELMLSLGDRDGDDCLSADELVFAVASILPPRQMAHERAPPPGYIDEFRPNVRSVDGKLVVDPSVTPLTDDELRALEARYRAAVRQ
ncbi:MAG: hypothetical protein RL398_3011 [Planctomycetota bacterium]